MAVLDCVDDFSNPVNQSSFFGVEESFTAIIQSFETDFRDGTRTSSGGELVSRIVLGFPESLPLFEMGDLVHMTTASNDVGLENHALSVVTELEVLATDQADPCTP